MPMVNGVDTESVAPVRVLTLASDISTMPQQSGDAADRQRALEDLGRAFAQAWLQQRRRLRKQQRGKSH